MWGDVLILYLSYLSLLTLTMSLFGLSLSLDRAFTITAIAQLCVLGLMWLSGVFLFKEGALAAAYIFTILNGLQGALIFLLNCLLSKQVGQGVCVCACLLGGRGGGSRNTDWDMRHDTATEPSGKQRALRGWPACFICRIF